ncbi:uncharacterized protein PFB0765w-like [Mizuhopecten yessoensis]|uniref:Laminin subunit beta-4 n=1 Tax=Mizuhopecten yessoensis TaxID=6573 RepID=A0A210QXK6_MIZYE|nr:uncharacterized protein PFB0765w-like [Mizuhopecten yessoensis]XP_021346993.1 uncharacterized protein PFB0765w-like [Mizuhopecten yessoensis]XP_021346994.1 uncharacterized protein PFB0765w-like [Mizuhopecten yessoensis]XP_021346995.1 uncharacterized protein PFB0765w-like [Mizuhopecten yessoensis]XP_021346996.1 uncharacterized protein PFB0765w-like [Mizuhopecten yessoensis]XP_021346997.1 uncharacterized protein PFB0765w-like [Mizuhopecten yessoensis]XP_021346998.1 uncharacterized protein PF
MADVSMITDDEYVSPDEFNDEITNDLNKKVNELSKQLKNMKIEKDEAHRYINDMSAKIASHGELEKEVKRLTILNHDLENRLQAEDKAYVKLWKEVSPSKDNGSGEKTDPATTSTERKEESDTNSGILNEKTPTSQADKTVQQNQDRSVTVTASVTELTEEIRRKEERIQELKNEVKTLKSSLQETLKIKDKYKKTLEKLRDEKQALSEETSRRLTQGDNKMCKMEENLRLMTARRDQLEKDLEKANEELDLTEKKLTAVKKGHQSTLAEDGKAMSSELGIVHVDELREALVTKSVECEKMLLKNEELKKILEEKGSTQGKLEERLTLITSRKDQLEKDLEKAKEDLDQMAKKLTKVNQDHKSTLIENEMAISSGSECLQLEVDTLIKDRYNQNESQVCFDSLTVQPPKTRKSIEIGLRSLRSGMGKTMVDGVTKGLQKLLHDRLLREKIDLHIKPCQTLDDATGGPHFVLCLAKSIIGTKVQALEGIPGNKDTVLIIIYYTETDTKECLSMSIPSFRLYGSELRPLGGTIDMLFGGGSGLYDCDVNNSAVERITTFLKKY